MTNFKKDFPIFENRSKSGKSFVYLDTASSAQKPKAVLDKMLDFYSNSYSNVHRGVSNLNQEASEQYELARQKVSKFLNAPSAESIVFTQGTTDSINMIARCYGLKNFKPGSKIILSRLEHHSNIVPWQEISKTLDLKIKYLDLSKEGRIDIESLKDMVSEDTAMISLVHCSNVLGWKLDAKKVINIAHAMSVPVLLDGCQTVAHAQVDVKELEVDFYCFSSHKIYGPSGVGALYIAPKHFASIDPGIYRGGGGMVVEVFEDHSTYREMPYGMEAGTPPIAGAIGLGAAIDYVTGIGLGKIEALENDLFKYAKISIEENVKNASVLGEGSIFSVFIKDNHGKDIHPHDIGTLISQEHGVSARVGHHCCQLLMKAMGWTATLRVSFGVYNDLEDVNSLVFGLLYAQDVMNRY